MTASCRRCSTCSRLCVLRAPLPDGWFGPAAPAWVCCSRWYSFNAPVKSARPLCRISNVPSRTWGGTVFLNRCIGTVGSKIFSVDIAGEPFPLRRCCSGLLLPECLSCVLVKFRRRGRTRGEPVHRYRFGKFFLLTWKKKKFSYFSSYFISIYRQVWPFFASSLDSISQNLSR